LGGTDINDAASVKQVCIVEMEGPLKTRSVQEGDLAREKGNQILGSPLTGPHDALTDLLFTLKEARLIAGSLDNGVLIYFLEMAALEARACSRNSRT
jgi:hypothetical protein